MLQASTNYLAEHNHLRKLLASWIPHQVESHWLSLSVGKESVSITLFRAALLALNGYPDTRRFPPILHCFNRTLQSVGAEATRTTTANQGNIKQLNSIVHQIIDASLNVKRRECADNASHYLGDMRWETIGSILCPVRLSLIGHKHDLTPNLPQQYVIQTIVIELIDLKSANIHKPSLSRIPTRSGSKLHFIWHSQLPYWILIPIIIFCLYHPVYPE